MTKTWTTFGWLVKGRVHLTPSIKSQSPNVSSVTRSITWAQNSQKLSTPSLNARKHWYCSSSCLPCWILAAKQIKYWPFYQYGYCISLIRSIGNKYSTFNILVYTCASEQNKEKEFLEKWPNKLKEMKSNPYLKFSLLANIFSSFGLLPLPATLQTIFYRNEGKKLILK